TIGIRSAGARPAQRSSATPSSTHSERCWSTCAEGPESEAVGSVEAHAHESSGAPAYVLVVDVDAEDRAGRVALVGDQGGRRAARERHAMKSDLVAFAGAVVDEATVYGEGRDFVGEANRLRVGS